MDFPLTIPTTLRDSCGPGERVLLGLSGGVDSGVALALLTHLGCEVITVTFKNFCYSDNDNITEKSCCSLDAIEDAQALAFRFGAQHWVADVVDLFQQEVIDPFVKQYSCGLTPNPCLDCNSRVRFPEMIRLADQRDCTLVATGHYARHDLAEQILLSGIDPDKDQAYFLSRVDRRLRSRIVYPLGWYTKQEVRLAARKLGLIVADKAESQEICFVPSGDRSFLFSNADVQAPGPIIDRQGNILGHHRGLIHYTVGQRRGLGIAYSEPLYVLEVDTVGNRLIVGVRAETAVTRISCTDFQVSVDRLPSMQQPAGGKYIDSSEGVIARIRHRHLGARVVSWVLEGQLMQVELADDVHGVAPGQALVLYQRGIVLGCGTIVSTS